MLVWIVVDAVKAVGVDRVVGEDRYVDMSSIASRDRAVRCR